MMQLFELVEVIHPIKGKLLVRAVDAANGLWDFNEKKSKKSEETKSSTTSSSSDTTAKRVVKGRKVSTD